MTKKEADYYFITGIYNSTNNKQTLSVIRLFNTCPAKLFNYIVILK